MQQPVNAPISSPFGPRSSGFHAGVDYKVPEGTSVSANTSGTVVRASWHPDYGNVIVIDHGPIGPDGEHVYTLYAHLKEMNVKLGDTISEGQEIGESGGNPNSTDYKSGRSTGPHLHYEVIQSSTPLPWRPTGKMGVRGKEHRLDPKIYFDEAFTAFIPTRRDPLILDLDGDGIATTNVKDGAYFDHDGNGFVEQTGWVDPHDGLLVRDINGNGTIDNGKELFGDQTVLKNGSNAANGFAALADLDENHDGKIDANDAAYSQLRVWQDADGDGLSLPEELKSLADAGIQSINLTSTPSTITDPEGNTQTRIGSFEKTDGTTGQIANFNLQRDTTYTITEEWLDVPEDIAALPDLQGYGNIYDLQQSMAREAVASGQGSGAGEVLKGLVEQFIATTDVNARKNILDQIIFKWAGTEGIASNSRGVNMDARKLATLEKFFGQAFVGANGANPTSAAAIPLNESYRGLSEMFYAQLMAQTHLKDLYGKITYTWDDAKQSVKDMSAVIADIQTALAGDAEQGKALLSEFSRTLRGFGAQDIINFYFLLIILIVAFIRIRNLQIMSANLRMEVF